MSDPNTDRATPTEATSNGLLPLDTLGRTIKAHIAAGDKSIAKAEEHYTSAGLHLKAAKERVAHTKGLTWSAFVIKNCSIGTRRADELISIADGRTTLAELREKNAISKRDARAARSAGHPAQSSEIGEQEQESKARTKVTKRRAAAERKEEADRERGGFLLAADTAIESAFYNGKVDAEIIALCRSTIAAWTKLLKQLEEKLHIPTSQVNAVVDFILAECLDREQPATPVQHLH